MGTIVDTSKMDVMEGDEKSEFDLRLVSQYFTDSKDDDGNISLVNYIKGYRELCKFFNLFGTVFSFVTSDVLSKCQILENYQKSCSDTKAYDTVQSMVSYEIEHQILLSQKGKNGCRTLLRLHRALDFCSQLLEGINGLKKEEKLSNITWEVYGRTLSNFHTWIVRKAVGMATYVLPTKQSLQEKMGNPSDEEAARVLSCAVSSMRQVYDVVQHLYTENDLLNLN